MAEGEVQANGIQIWYETFGNPSDPTILLIQGAASQALLWTLEFCEGLVAGGRHVVWFDNRDIGLSQWFGDDEPYTLDDMSDDTAGLLDALGIPRAHLVGASMGGMIGQAVAIRDPERALTLTSIMSSPGLDDASLEGPDPEYMANVQEIAAAQADSREERIEQQLRLYRALAGPAVPYEEEYWKKVHAESVDRSWRPDSHHVEAIYRSPSRLEALRDLTVPTLVIHGTADPIVSYSHAVATVEAVPGARLLPLEGVGHEIPRAFNDQVIGAILEHTG